MVQIIELVKREVFRFYYIILEQDGYQFSIRSFTLLPYELQTQNLVNKVPGSVTEYLPSTSLTAVITECMKYKSASS
jgi:hypothetical protein